MTSPVETCDECGFDGDPGTDLGDAPVPAFEPEPRAIDVDAALAGLTAEADRLSRALADTPSASL
ncbi:MAG TPA: hypothetical protein VKH36_10795 [Acidimicrobiia bacterium]|nr:hypothetical protein [Acidimicrobiia bacterium]